MVPASLPQPPKHKCRIEFGTVCSGSMNVKLGVCALSGLELIRGTWSRLHVSNQRAVQESSHMGLRQPKPRRHRSGLPYARHADTLSARHTAAVWGECGTSLDSTPRAVLRVLVGCLVLLWIEDR